jgi:RNA polymerase sigma-70 factor (ECF subfamily)
MSASPLDTQQLAGWMAKIDAGDPSALDGLLRHAADRLERLARHMLGTQPAVQRWAQTGDVLQGALVRLARALATLRPTSTREFFALATQQLRRELIDLARHYYGAQGVGANHASGSGLVEASDRTHDPDGLAEWTELHERIEQLPQEERAVVDLLFYQGLQQAEAASILGVTVRTVQRRWQSALVQLHAAMRGKLPGM